MYVSVSVGVYVCMCVCMCVYLCKHFHLSASTLRCHKRVADHLDKELQVDVGGALRCQKGVTDHLNIELQPEVLGIGLGSSTRAVGDPSCCGISLTTINFLCQYTELKEQKRIEDQGNMLFHPDRKRHVFPSSAIVKHSYCPF